jgi:alpha-tubulin suppressor-like RCC1 family protein
MGIPSLRRSASVLFLVCAAGCIEASPVDPSCSDGRSRCVAQVSLGAHFGCALLRDRSVWCWGRNDEAQLGYPTTDLCPDELPDGQTRAVACHAFPFQVLGLDRAVAVSAGGAFACALRDDGTLRCWGSNSAGQLGNGLTLPSSTPATVLGLAGVTAVATGARHACAVADGRVYCWGANDRGQLGQVATSRQCAVGAASLPCETLPTVIDTLADVVAITVGAAHTCARTSKGIVICWGDDRYGQMGDGQAATMPAANPRAVIRGEEPIDGVLDLASAGDFTCGRNAEGLVWCWGRNDLGQLGSAATGSVPANCSGPCSPRPTQVPGLDFRVSLVDAGTDASTDALSEADGEARWDAGGDGGRDAGVDAPDDVTTADGGAGDAGDAGDATEPGDVVPVRDAVAAPSMVPRGIAVGGTFGCAVLDDGTVRCWGDDSLGQLGDGQRGRDPQGPVMVIATPGAAATNPLQRVVSIAGGVDNACALLADGSLRCWGSNRSGALGIGSTSVQAGPVPVSW